MGYLLYIIFKLASISVNLTITELEMTVLKIIRLVNNSNDLYIFLQIAYLLKLNNIICKKLSLSHDK